jgi:hypothetical protein
MSPSVPGNRDYRLTSNVWSVHLVATNSHPEKMRLIKGIPCHGPKGPSWTLFGAQELSARGFIHCGTDFIAQVAQTCYLPVTNTRGNRISITSYHKPNSLHHPRATKLSTCRHFHTRAFQTAPFGSSCQASLSACVKKQPPAKGLFEFHLWTTCLGGRSSFSVAFLKFSYRN